MRRETAGLGESVDTPLFRPFAKIPQFTSPRKFGARPDGAMGTVPAQSRTAHQNSSHTHARTHPHPHARTPLSRLWLAAWLPPARRELTVAALPVAAWTPALARK